MSATSTTCCAHCGLPVAGGRRQQTTPVFCCIGCRLAFAAGGGDEGRRSTLDGPGPLEARLLLSAFLAMGVMTFSLVLYGEPLLAAGDEAGMAAVRNVVRGLLAVFSLPVLLLLGVPLARGAWADLRAGRVRMDGLIVLATGAAWALSVAHTWRGTGEVYYETATMVLVLITFGRRLEAHARTRGRDAADALADQLPRVAHRLDGAPGEERLHDVAPGELAVGDVIHVLPGEPFPADALVLEGHGEVGTAHVTGEQAPRAVGPEAELPAGASNGPTRLVARVLAAGGDDALGRIRRLLDAPLPPTHTTRLVDRLAGVLAGVALVLAGVGGLLALRTAPAGEGAGAALQTALAVLLVACPCALGLATPLAYRAVRGALARRGVLVRTGRALERAAEVDLVVFDKTGTLTEPGPPEILAAASPDAARRLEAMMAHSGHALAVATRRHGRPPDALRLHGGRGVEGRLDGVACRTGHVDWVAPEAAWDPAVRAARHDGGLAATADTLVAHAEDGRVVALARLGQRLRPGARETAEALGARGVRLAVLSGDHRRAVEEIAAALGAEAVADVTPDGKLDWVRARQAEGRTLLLAGDGVNDAPALRAVDVGVAMGAGTAAAREQAEVELAGDDLRALPALLEAAAGLRRTVRGNLAWTLAYNAVALALAVTGRLHPLAAVAAMIVSSLVVSVRSWRLLDRRPLRAGWAGAPSPVPVP